MKRWQELELWLKRGMEITGTGPGQFSFAQKLLRDAIMRGDRETNPRRAGARASAYITAYLDEMRKPDTQCEFFIHRTGRTTNSIWHVGHKTEHARSRGAQFVDDTVHTIEASLLPDFVAIERRNPRARPAIDALRAQIRLAVAAFDAQLRDLDNDDWFEEAA
jgi:hypothetical protein